MAGRQSVMLFDVNGFGPSADSHRYETNFDLPFAFNKSALWLDKWIRLAHQRFVESAGTEGIEFHCRHLAVMARQIQNYLLLDSCCITHGSSCPSFRCLNCRFLGSCIIEFSRPPYRTCRDRICSLNCRRRCRRAEVFFIDDTGSWFFAVPRHL